MRLVSSAVVLVLIVGPLAFAMGGAAPRQVAPWPPPAKRADAVKVLIVTGGHDHDASFYSLFEGYEEISAVVNPHPNAFQNDMRNRVDVIVLYDSLRQLEPERQRHLRDFIEGGKGVVVLHHAICDYLNWPWWYEEVVGGRWLFEPAGGRPATSYQHDEEIEVRPIGKNPIVKDLRPFRIRDETYKGLWISPRSTVLLETNHPRSDGPLAWIGPSDHSRVVYIQLGHDRNAHLNPEYRRLVKNAILWCGGRLK
jgi:type 1 glutamine amidotransferase